MKPTIVIEDRVDLPGNPEVAWELLKQPEVLVSCIPGAEITGTDEDGSLLGAITLSLGPSMVTFKGRITVEYDEAEKTGVLKGKGADGKGRTQAAIECTFRLIPGESDGERTPVAIDSAVSVNGALAGFAASGGKAIARRLLEDFSENLTKLKIAEPEPAAEGEPTESVPQFVAAEPNRPISGFSLVFRALRDSIRRLFRRGKKNK